MKCSGAAGTVYAYIVDECPERSGSAGCRRNDVDFSEEAAKACTGEGWGEEPIEWSIVDCPDSPNGGNRRSGDSEPSNNDSDNNDNSNDDNNDNNNNDDNNDSNNNTSSGSDCNPQEGTKLPGPGYKTKFGVANANRCCKLCKREGGRCAGWSFNEQQSKCKLQKKPVGKPVDREGSVSGILS